MYLIYFLSGVSLVGLTLVGIGGFLGPRGFLGMNHPTLALMVSILFLAVEVLVMFFFVGTGVSVKEYVRDEGASPDFHRRSIALKRVLYPPTLAVTVAVMVTFILGGAVDRGSLSHWWHLAGWLLSMGLFLRALKVQHNCLKENTAIILEMVGLAGQQSSAAPSDGT